MLNAFLALSVLSILLVLMIFSVSAGRKFGKRQLEQESQKKLEIVNVAEGAVFALLGLLVAFTFSGAYERFEMRKIHIIEEANAYQTAYEYLDLFTPKSRVPLVAGLRAHLDAHLKTYRDIPYLHFVAKDVILVNDLEAKIWEQTIAAANIAENRAVVPIVIPAISRMFDVATTGFLLTKVHPPLTIFFLLIGLAVIGGYLAGYTTAASKIRNSIHILSYVVLTAFIIYVIIDLEFPRIGLIRATSFDQLLVDVRDGWH